MLDTVQPEQQNKTNDSETTTKRENIQVEDKDVYSATRVAEQKKCSETLRKRENIQAENNAGHSTNRVAEKNK